MEIPSSAIEIPSAINLQGTWPTAIEEESLSVIVINEIAELMRYRAQIEELAAKTREPNIFFEPWMLFPALANYAESARMVFVLLFNPDDTDDKSTLYGFIPLEEKQVYRGLPLSCLVLWHYPHCFQSTPLLHRDGTDQAVKSLMEWFSGNQKYKLLEFRQIPVNGQFSETLKAELLMNNSKYLHKDYQRPVLYCEKDFAAYTARHTSSRFRTRMRANMKKLSARGAVEFRRLTAAEHLEQWIDDFLELEASGWKGRSGTAMVQNTRDKGFFESIARAAFTHNSLSSVSLCLDGKPIAMEISFLSTEGCFAFKRAYNEDYRDYSPGVLLDMEVIRLIHENPQLKWMDSCADVSSQIFGQIFIHRKDMSNLTIANSNITSNAMVRLLPTLMRMKKALAN
jgi:hypothetical protein